LNENHENNKHRLVLLLQRLLNPRLILPGAIGNNADTTAFATLSVEPFGINRQSHHQYDLTLLSIVLFTQPTNQIKSKNEIKKQKKNKKK